MKQGRLFAAFALLVLVFVLGFRASRSVLAQRQSDNLSVRVNVQQASYAALRETPVMVSVIKDGAVLKQEEVSINSNASFAIPAGLYDVRLEGAGMETVVKRGIHVQAAETMSVIGVMRTGTGVKIVEYAVGGMSREEIAARLTKLEAAVAELQKRNAAR